MRIRFLTSEKNFRGNVFITGFHGIGATGYIAVSHFVEALNAKRIGFIETEVMPAFVFMDKITGNDILVTPFEMYKSGKFVFLKNEFPLHHNDELKLAKALANWIIEKKFKETVLIGGLDNSFKTGEGRFRVVATEPLLNKVKTLNFKLLEQRLSVYGPLAIMLSVFEMAKFPAIAVLPYSVADRPDPRAAAVGVEEICKIYGLDAKVTRLIRDAELIESEIESHQDMMKRSTQGMYV
jgi:uncharacterized protein